MPIDVAVLAFYSFFRYYNCFNVTENGNIYLVRFNPTNCGCGNKACTHLIAAHLFCNLPVNGKGEQKHHYFAMGRQTKDKQVKVGICIEEKCKSLDNNVYASRPNFNSQATVLVDSQSQTTEALNIKSYPSNCQLQLPIELSMLKNSLTLALQHKLGEAALEWVNYLRFHKNAVAEEKITKDGSGTKCIDLYGAADEFFLCQVTCMYIYNVVIPSVVGYPLYRQPLRMHPPWTGDFDKRLREFSFLSKADAAMKLSARNYL
uniref:SWIM-type domain-containing protein n=1 Tax=Romanomermis culicivorax TaxID=13658 RepID=A0A915KUK8_ROMCU